MPLSPLDPNSPRIIVDEETEIEPSRTYEFDFATGEFTGRMIDGDEAVRQFITKAIVTPRFRHLIYDHTFGSELESLIAESLPLELTTSEARRMVTEALIYDSRIDNVISVTVEQVDDRGYIDCTAITNRGSIITAEGVV